MSSSSYSRMDDDGEGDGPAEHAVVVAPPPVPSISSSSSRSSGPPPLLSSSSTTPRLTSPLLCWLYQLLALWRKSLLLLRQQPLLSLSLLLLPCLFVLINYGISTLVQQSYSPSAISHASFSTSVGRCVTLDVYGQPSSACLPCVSLTYAPHTPDTADIISRLLAATSLTPSDVQAYPDVDSLLLAWTRSVASQDLAILFHNLTSPLTSLSARYTLLYNQSSPNADWRALAVQFALEQAIANTLITSTVRQFPPSPSPSPILNQSSPHTNLPYQALPPSPLTPTSLSYSYLPQSSTSTGPTQYNDGASQYVGGSLLAIGVTILTLLVIQHTTAEKQSRVLAMLRMNGLFDSAYWLGVLACYTVVWAVTALLATLVGLACGLQVYVEGSVMVHWVALFLFLTSMTACGLFVSSLVSRPRWVGLVCFLLLALTAGYSFGVSMVEGAPYYVSQASPVWQLLQYAMPIFHWDKLWLDMSYHSEYQRVTNATDGSSYIAQQRMTWATLYQPSMTLGYCPYLDLTCCAAASPQCIVAPAPGTNLGYLVLLTLVYTALAWYASQVGDELSGGKRAWFLCTASYWSRRGTRPPAQQLIDGDTQMRERMRSREEQSIRTVKLSKAFKGTTAVKELTLSMQPNEVFCLLGHNGAGQRRLHSQPHAHRMHTPPSPPPSISPLLSLLARRPLSLLRCALCALAGKTTTINLLTGLYAQTFGEAYVCGYSIRDDIAQIQQLLGVCTQDNILWEQLSVAQHLDVMAAIRCLPPACVPDVVRSRLQLVNLWEHRHKRASELSGGMKRRLSIALALMGDPRVLFLDEPTTGMDPVHRAEVWEAIRHIKADRVVLLTTHAMDEADQLGDRIGLLASGRLRALGSSLFLKNSFGRGYQLQLLVAPQDVPQLTQAVEQYLVGCTIVGKEAGAVTIALKRDQLRNVPLLFRWIEGALSKDPASAAGGGGGKGELLKEWSISNSTLEEVFLRLCAADKVVNAGVEAVVEASRAEEDERLRKCAVCHTRPVSVVTLYTAGGVPVVLPNVLCGPCAWGPVLAEQKAREETERAAAESKVDDDGGRIDWSLHPSGSLNPTASVASNGDEGATLPTDAASSPSSPPSSSSIQNSVGKVPPTTWQQVRSIFLKDLALAWTEKKGWLLRVAIILVMIALVVVYANASFTAGNWLFCPQGYALPTHRSGVACDDASMRGYLFGASGSAGTGQHSVWALDQDVDDEGGLGGGVEPAWLRCSSVGYCWTTSLLSHPTVMLYSADGGGALGLAGYDLGWGVVGWNATNNATSTSPSFVDWTPLLQSTGLTPSQQVAANEQLVIARAAAGAASACPNPSSSSSSPVWWLPSQAQALEQAAWLYPDQVIYVRGQRSSGAGDAYLSYELSSFTYEDSSSPPLIGYPTCFTVPVPTPRQSFPTSAWHLVHGLSNALLYTSLHNHSSYTQGRGVDVWRQADAPGVRGTVATVPPLTYFPALNDALVGMVVTFLLFPSLLLLPWFADRLLYEREEGLYHAMRIAGLRASSYWLGNYLFDSVVSWLWCLSLIVAGYASGASMFTRVSPALWLLLYLVWIHAQLGVSALLSALLTKRRLASVLACLLVIVVSAGSFGYASWAYSRTTWAWYLNLLPPLTFMRALTVLIRYQPSIGQALAVGSDFANALNACLWVGTAYLVLAMLVHSLRYQSLEQLLTALPWYRARMQRRKEVEEEAHSGDARLSAAFLPLQPDSSGEDEDVQLERQRVIDQQRSAAHAQQPPAISILNLRKSFTGGGLLDSLYSSLCSLLQSADATAARKSRVVDAVQGLYLNMAYGECFGLLGPNGAGQWQCACDNTQRAHSSACTSCPPPSLWLRFSDPLTR